MPVHVIAYRFTFEAAHRVLGHKGRCKYLHGHGYQAEVQISPSDGMTLDRLGMVVDFAVMKERIGSFINLLWDHNILLHPEDPMVVMLQDRPDIHGRDPFVMPHGLNPTAENLAAVLAVKAQQLMAVDNLNVALTRVRETENGWATYWPHMRPAGSATPHVDQPPAGREAGPDGSGPDRSH